jgi:hypothetical protein
MTPICCCPHTKKKCCSSIVTINATSVPYLYQAPTTTVQVLPATTAVVTEISAACVLDPVFVCGMNAT